MNIAEHIRYRFRDEDRDAQVIIGKRDYEKIIKRLMKGAGTDKKTATAYLHFTFKSEIRKHYGEPSKVSLILVDEDISVQ